MRPEDDWESFIDRHPDLVTYQLIIYLGNRQSIQVGRLGNFDFPAGMYVYTGSAQRGLVSRVRRHLAVNKKFRWHIDYMLSVSDARVVELHFSARPECTVNQQGKGEVIVPGFGASDCRLNCNSHLKYLGTV